MTELDLYKFITDNEVEWHRHDRDGEDDVIIMPYIFHLEEFTKLFNVNEEGVDIKLMNGYVCIWMKDLCEYYGVEMNNVFKGNNYDE
jgi:hypothetical protein